MREYREPDLDTEDDEEENLMESLEPRCLECGEPVEHPEDDMCRECFRLSLAACNGSAAAERRLEDRRERYSASC